MSYWLGVIGTWIISDGLYSWSLYKHSEGWNGANQTFKKDHWVRLVRIILGFILVLMGM